MDVTVPHGIDWLVQSGFRFKVGERAGRPCAAVVTEQRVVCVDLAMSEVCIDAVAAEGEQFLDVAYDDDNVAVLIERDDQIALTRFWLLSGPDTRPLFESPGARFPCALAIGPTLSSIALNTFDGIWFTSTSSREWPEPLPRVGDIWEWFYASLIDLVTIPETGGTFCGMAHHGWNPGRHAAPRLAGGEMDFPDDEGWSKADPMQGPLHPTDRSRAGVTDIRCILLGDRPALVYATLDMFQARDLKTGEVVLGRGLSHGVYSGDEPNVWSVDILGGLVALLLDYSIEVRDLDSFDVVYRISLGPQRTKTEPDGSPSEFPSRHTVRLLETDQGMVVVWLEDHGVRAVSLRRALPARTTPTPVPRRTTSLDVARDGSLIAWIDQQGTPWVLAGRDAQPVPLRTLAHWTRIAAGSLAARHPLLLSGRSDDDWRNRSFRWTATTSASTAAGGLDFETDGDIAHAVYNGDRWLLSLYSGEVRAIGEGTTRGWHGYSTGYSLLAAADWAVVDASNDMESSRITIRSTADGRPLAEAHADAVVRIAAAWSHNSSVPDDLFVICSTENRDVAEVLILTFSMYPAASFDEILRLRHCHARDVALTAASGHMVAALLFSDRCDMIDASTGELLASAALDTDRTVLIEGPWDTHFLAGDRVHALHRYGLHGEFLTEEVKLHPVKPRPPGLGDLRTPARTRLVRSRPASGTAPSEDWTTGAAADEVFGDSGRWTRTLPLLWRMFAPGTGPLNPPRPPTPDDGWDSPAGFDYWNPLLHLVLGPLGWADPGLGAERWLAADLPVVCNATRVLWEWWGEDVRALSAMQDSRGTPGRAASEIEDALRIEPRTPQALPGSLIKASPPSWISLMAGGDDPLHLGAHAVAALVGRAGYDDQTRRFESPSIAFDDEQGSGALVLPAYVGWYRQLHETGERLERQRGIGLRLDVVVRPIGWLGTYERSKTTGRWYACSHDTHLLGFPGGEEQRHA